MTKSARIARRRHGGGDHPYLFITKRSTLARVRIERSHHNSRLGESEPLSQSLVSKLDEFPQLLRSEHARHLGVGDVIRGQQHA
jgi:hypothetical protein